MWFFLGTTLVLAGLPVAHWSDALAKKHGENSDSAGGTITLAFFGFVAGVLCILYSIYLVFA